MYKYYEITIMNASATNYACFNAPVLFPWHDLHLHLSWFPFSTRLSPHALLQAYSFTLPSLSYLSSSCLSFTLADSDPTEVSTVSEAVYHEYDDLRQRYKVETESMAQAFNRATEVR